MINCFEKDECIKNSKTYCQTNGTCFRTIKRWKNGFCEQAGCLDDRSFHLYCKNKLNQEINYGGSKIICCNLNECNKISSIKWEDLQLTKYLSITIGCLIVILILVLIYKKRKFKKQFKKNNSQLDDFIIEKSFHKLITLSKENLGEGRYGKVIKGLLNDQEVAVKIFNSDDYDSFKKELDIYKISSLSRESILKCIGWDTVYSLTNFSTEYWLILDFCKLGSLYDYLQTNTLKKDQLLSIMISAISGLNHLHDSQEFTVSKPAISHRDFKSKNLLMKSDKTVCIADFGLSLTSNDTRKEEPIKIQQGTKRYFSPEVLDETLNINEFESFTLSDIYSFSLVFWESLNRSEFNPKSKTFHLPYFEYTNNDPSIEEMKKIVVHDNLRPKLLVEPDEKFCNFNDLDHMILASMCSIIKTCWDYDPKKRLNTFQIKKKLEDLYLKINKN